MDSERVVCPECGAALGLNRRFCEQCGARLAMDPVPASAAPPARLVPVAAAGTPPGGLTWSRRIPLLTNRFMLWDFTWVFAASVVSLYVVVAVMALVVEGELVLLPLEVGLLVAAVLAGLFGVTALLMFGNGYNMVFTLDERGATWRSGPRERNIGRLAWVVGLFALLQGRPGLLGSATLAQSQEGSGIEWQDLHEVKVYPRERVISLHNSWRAVLRLYCLPENFDAVRAMVEAELATARRRQAIQPRRENRYTYNWRPRLLACLGVTIAALTCTAWDAEAVAGFAFASWLSLILAVLLEGGPRRLFGAFGLGAAGMVALALWSLGSEQHSWAQGLVVSYGYEYDTPLFIISVAGTVVLLLIGAQRTFLGRRSSSQAARRRAV